MKATICVIFIVAVAAAVAAMNDEPYNMPTTTVDVTKSSGLRADSDLGMKLLSHARRVEEGNNHADGGEQQQQQADYSWVAKFSLKFQACHHVQQVRYTESLSSWCATPDIQQQGLCTYHSSHDGLGSFRVLTPF